MASYYPPSYWDYSGKLGKLRKILFGFFQKRRNRWVEENLSSGVILDVGSGEGNFGKLLSEKFKIVNLEAPFAKLKNRKVITADFLIWKTSQKFDCICFWESLEHVTSPQSYLSKAKRLLKKDGLVLIEYPRFNSLESAILGKNWFHLDFPRHLTHLTDSGLKIILKRAGFIEIRKESVLAIDYSPGGLLLSLTNLLGIEPQQTLEKSKNPILLLLFGVLFSICTLAEFLLFLTGDAPIGLVIAKKNNL